MDPVTTAILSAISAGVLSGGPKVIEKTIADAYDQLKEMLRKKFGQDHVINSALADLEKHSDSAGRKATLSEEVEKASAQQDPEVLRVATALSELLKPAGGGRSYSQNATGTNIAQAADHSSASVNAGAGQPFPKTTNNQS
jgi:hypothetical protein